MDEQKKKQAQKSVLEAILNKGIKFDITYTAKVRRSGFLGFLGAKTEVEKHETFTIQEPTLGVLDRMSEIWLDFDIEDIEKMTNSEVMVEGYKMANKHAKDMARILAIAVLGERYYSMDDGDKEEERLTELFYRVTKPSQLPHIAMSIVATSHLADFITSMRLMRMSVTTTPTARIE